MLPNGEVKIYSRNLEDTTERFPDIVQSLPTVFSISWEIYIYMHPPIFNPILQFLPCFLLPLIFSNDWYLQNQVLQPGVQSFIMDCEVVAWDTGKNGYIHIWIWIEDYFLITLQYAYWIFYSEEANPSLPSIEYKSQKRCTNIWYPNSSLHLRVWSPVFEWTGN